MQNLFERGEISGMLLLVDERDASIFEDDSRPTLLP